MVTAIEGNLMAKAGRASQSRDELALLTKASSKIEIQGGRYPESLEAQTNL